MNTAAIIGHVASLHLHPAESGAPFQNVVEFELVEGQGIIGDARYFGRLGRDTGQPSRRQVTLMDRKEIIEHATVLGLPSIPAGAVRSNIETMGTDLIAHLGHDVQIGDAVLRLYAPRDPCAKMDAICHGLRALMMGQHQGVLAEVIRSGKIRVGDPIRKRET
jgi:MOSC domain-containing protein YiiM